MSEKAANFTKLLFEALHRQENCTLNQSLTEEFHREVIRLCDVTNRETPYNPKGFRGKVLRVGGYEATTDILNSSRDNWGGFTELVLHQRLDLSLENLVLQERWQPLFSIDQLRNAQRRLQRLDYPNVPELLEKSTDTAIDNKPERREYTSNSIVRNANLARQVKELYDYRCQVCRIVLVAGNRRYSEAAHIKPVGEPHNGSDTLNNVLCLCPNHHKLFDMGGFFVEDNLEIPLLGVKLFKVNEHDICIENIRYHKTWFDENA